MTRYHEVARKAAEALGLLDETGALVQLDSLTMIDLVIAIEDEMDLKIPPEEVQAASFTSIDAIAAMLSRI